MGTPITTPPIPFWEMEPPEAPQASGGLGSSHETSQPGSGGRRREKKRVGFTAGDDSNGRSPRDSWEGPGDGSSTPPEQAVGDNALGQVLSNTLTHSRSGSTEMPHPGRISRSHLPELTSQQTQEIHEALAGTKLMPAIRRTQSNPGDSRRDDDDDVEGPFDYRERAHRAARQHEAYDKAKRFEDRKDRESDSDDGMPTLKGSRTRYDREAERLMRRHTASRDLGHDGYVSASPSGVNTPVEEQDYTDDYQARPNRFRGGLLHSLLRIYNSSNEATPDHSRKSSIASLLPRLPRSRQGSVTPTPRSSPPESGTSTPTGKEWFSRKQRNRSAPTLGRLVGTSAGLGAPVLTGLGEQVTHRLREQKQKPAKPGMGLRSSSATALAKLGRVTGHHKRRNEERERIRKHMADTLERQDYLLRLCRALMQYGAPTHRLEEYMRMSARVLEIDAQFLYIPGSMIVSFDDSSTHTTEVKLVRVNQGLNLGKLRDVHDVYKDVVHDALHPRKAMDRLQVVNDAGPKTSRWIRIPIYGVAAATVGPFAFQARLIDLPIIFFLGCILGFLQLVVAPASDLYANVFEVSAAVITSFLSRAFGSIWNGNQRLFCFSALAQSSIALILPGYIVLTASLELQSRSIVAGSVRMVYAIIYSLFLGFGITIGTAIYGLMDGAASSETVCADPLPSKWYFLFVPIFTLSLIIINQAKWKQAPAMLVIALVGYIVNFYSAQRFVGNTQVSNTLGALAIGVLANLYSRVASKVENWTLDRWEDDIRPHWRKLAKRFGGKNPNSISDEKLEKGDGGDGESVYDRATRRVGYGLAVAAMLPAIFVQVPSGLSVNGSLVSGIASANQIAGSATNGTTVLNTTTINSASSGIQTNSIAFTVSYSVIQVAIGITVGLFLSAIVVYPFEPMRNSIAVALEEMRHEQNAFGDS